MPETLAQRVRAKYPGAYDDLNDQALESAVRTKFPGVYDDLPRSSAGTPLPAAATRDMLPPSTAQDQRPARSLGQQVGDAAVGAVQGVGDLATGAAKGAAHTVMGLGQIARKVPGVAQLDRIMAPIPVDDVPTGAAQRLGFGAEQIGEFFAPVGMVGRAARAAEVAKAGTLALAQTGSPTTAGVTAGLTAAVPGVGAVARVAAGLRGGAEKTMAQALGATKEINKATAAKLAPQMLARGVRGSRQTMLDQATSQTAAVGAKIGDEIASAASAGGVVSGEAIEGALQQAAKTLKVPDASGALIAIEGTQPVIQKLERLQKFVVALGPDIPVDKAAKIKTTLDHIVSKSGLYGQKSGASATDNASAWAVREAAGSFRALLADSNTTLAALNAEYAFWRGLKGVLTATVQRTQAQGGGLISAGMGGAGAIAGAGSGEGWDRVQNAVFGGLAGRQLVKTIQSPYFRTTISGPLKNKLADALASGNAERVTQAMGKITAAMPARLSSATGATP